MTQTYVDDPHVGDKFDADVERIISTAEKLKTLAIIGLEKNTGKTETLNFIVKHLKNRKKISITSIGTDGEEKDLVYGTLKPSVYVEAGFVYTTTEYFFRKRKVLSEILHVSQQSTATGRLVIARALERGKVVISGPPTVEWMKDVVAFMHRYSDMVIIDGALSRFSQATPFVADGIILATGAAYSLNKSEIIKHTRYIYTLASLPTVDKQTANILDELNGVYISDGEKWDKAPIESALNISQLETFGKTFKSIYISGALTDSILRYLHDREIIVRDFTKIFVTQETYNKYKPNIKVLRNANIIGITVNPLSPNGYSLDSISIIRELKNHLPTLPIIDVKL